MDKQEKKNLNQKLIEAAKSGNLEVVKYLVENGADIHAEKDYALRLAAYNGHLDVVKYLVEKGVNIHADGDYSLKLATVNGNLEVVKYLVEKGADIYKNDDESLKMASNHLEVLKYFLFDCQMKIKKETKDWLIENNQYQTLELIEKRNLLLKLDKNIIQKDAIDKFNKKIKI